MPRSPVPASAWSRRGSGPTATRFWRARATSRGSTSTATSTGGRARIIRKLQSVLSDDADHAKRYAEHLRDGHFVVGVSVGEDEAAKERAADALRASDAQFLNYYADNYVEDLGGNG